MSKINGKAKKYDGTPIDYVQIFNWITGNSIGVSKPDNAGNWSYDLYGKLGVGLAYVANGCEPIAHGPYYFDFPFDEHWSKVSLLLHFDGSSIDASKFSSFTSIGDISYTQGRFDNAMRFLPASSSAINGLLGNETGNQNLSLGMGDFTVELFVKPNSTYTQTDQVLISLFNTSGFAGWQVLLSGLKPAVYKYDGGGSTFLTSNVVLSTSTWHHLAFCRLNGVSSLYVDGVLTSSANDPSNYLATDVKISIGYQEYGGSRYPFSGVIDELRITKGMTRYNGNFTPPNNPFLAG